MLLLLLLLLSRLAFAGYHVSRCHASVIALCEHFNAGELLFVVLLCSSHSSCFLHFVVLANSCNVVFVAWLHSSRRLVRTGLWR
jgi:hypothetical protein